MLDFKNCISYYTIPKVKLSIDCQSKFHGILVDGVNQMSYQSAKSILGYVMYDALVCGLKHLDHLYRNKNKSQVTTETGSNFCGGDYVTSTTHIQYVGPKIWL